MSYQSEVIEQQAQQLAEILQYIRKNAAPDDDLINVRMVAQKLCISVDSVWKYNRAGLIPKPVSLGNGSTRWKRSEINAHIASLNPS